MPRTRICDETLPTKVLKAPQKADGPIAMVVALSCIKGFGLRQHGERGSVGDAELAINVVQMNLHGSLGQPQPPPDFLVGHALGNHPGYLPLAPRQR